MTRMVTLNLSQPARFVQNIRDPVLLKTIHCLGAEGQRLFYTMMVEDNKYGISRCWKILHAKSANIHILVWYRPVRCLSEGVCRKVRVWAFGGRDDLVKK